MLTTSVKDMANCLTSYNELDGIPLLYEGEWANNQLVNGTTRTIQNDNEDCYDREIVDVNSSIGDVYGQINGICVATWKISMLMLVVALVLAIHMNIS